MFYWSLTVILATDFIEFHKYNFHSIYKSIYLSSHIFTVYVYIHAMHTNMHSYTAILGYLESMNCI